ncbi:MULTISPECIES: DeoR/GlpR family DNA-binding transcription regulator [unclassified Bradyrhizobium]|uniref:DeoR/GlpR family DNA-binding transcription regulator n=1 Tax=unclassified Bradyrhizobium TaxID=2631580 RepID=UPI0029161179|nr:MULTISPECIES: DeoR/GlpR family DNA-binding transcription regulator [unclassified Bradyrhizobium]
MSDEIPMARRDLIGERLAQGQSVIAAALAAEFDVSEDAIRRDLRALAAEGLCRRVYGGALPITPGWLPMAARIGADRERKQALARAAATAIRTGEFIFLDSGSTNLALTEFLPEDAELTIATNSIDIATAVLQRQDLKLIMIGGAVDPVIGGSVDAGAVLTIGQMNVDRLFLGACAVSAKSGISAIDTADAVFKRTLLSVSRETLVLATTDKLETRAPHRVAAIKDIAHLVVEHDAPTAQLKALTKAGASILKAGPPA